MLRTRKATKREQKNFEYGVVFNKSNTNVYVYCKAVHHSFPERMEMKLTREQYNQMRSEGIINMEVPVVVYTKTGKYSERGFKNTSVCIRSNTLSNTYRRSFFAILDDMWETSLDESKHSFGIVEFEFCNVVLDM